MELYTAHHQWLNRPDDERFLDVQSLFESVKARKAISHEIEQLPLVALRPQADDTLNTLSLVMPSGMELATTHWSFGQLCRHLTAPADYLRRLPPSVTATNLQVGLQRPGVEPVKLLFARNGMTAARAFNGLNYGRIWDADVIEALIDTLDDRWQVPVQAYAGQNSLEATTLYASDRDVFVFLTDETRPIDVDGDTLFRGFFVWNSEVGSATFGISTFLFNYVCGNRIIWGAKQVEELRIRHTAIAPRRFWEEARPVLVNISESSPQPVIELVQRAKNTQVAKDHIGAFGFLRRHGFTKSEAQTAVTLAQSSDHTGSSGDPTNLWNLVMGGTAAARSIPHADQRVEREKRFSSLLKLAGRTDFSDVPQHAEEEYERELSYA